ncbi:MAG: APC family permease [bacterium]
MSARLERSVGLWGAVWMGLGSIVGTGVFVSLGVAAGVAGPAIIIAVALAALVALANGLSSAALAAAHPVSGGTYEYGHRLVHPVAGFAAGCMFLAAKGASAATAALGFAGYLLHALALPARTGARIGVALALVVVLTALVAGGVRRSNRANAAIVSLTLLALAAFVGVGLANIDPTRLAEHLGGATDVSLAALLHATALMFVAYTGYGRIATLGEEVVEPARTIPRAIVVTLASSAALYLAVAFTAVAAVGANAFAASTHAIAAPLEAVARTFAQPWVAPIVALGAVSAMAGVLLNLLLGLSRVLLAMARRGEAPGGLARVETGGNPRRAVLAVGGVIAALVLLGDVKTTWSFSAFAVLIYYGITHIAALRLPAAQRRWPRGVAVVGLVACFGLAFFVEPAIWLAGGGVLAVGFALRALAGKRSA